MRADEAAFGPFRTGSRWHRICIEAVPTLPTEEKALRTAMHAGTMPTTDGYIAETCAGGLLDATRLCFIAGEAPQVRTAPAMHPALAFTALVGHALSGSGEVFKHNGTAGDNSLHEVCGEDVSVIIALPKQFSTQRAPMAPG